MKDLVGNKLEKGNLVYWLEGKVIAHVIDVEEPKIETSGERPSFVTVAIRFPVMRQRGESEAVMAGFLRVIDPSQQDSLDRALGPQIVKPS